MLDLLFWPGVESYLWVFFTLSFCLDVSKGTWLTFVLCLIYIGSLLFEFFDLGYDCCVWQFLILSLGGIIYGCCCWVFICVMFEDKFYLRSDMEMDEIYLLSSVLMAFILFYFFYRRIYLIFRLGSDWEILKPICLY